MIRTRWRSRLKKEGLPVARRRVSRLASPDLLDHAEVCTIYAGQALSQWRRGGGDAALDDVERNLLSLLEITRELRARNSR